MTKKQKTSVKESAFFIKNAFLKPKQVGYLFPSTQALIKTIAQQAQLNKAKYIVELGPGTGGTTRGILAQMQDDTQLVAVEINKDFIDFLAKSITDKRLKLVHDAAQNLKQIIKNQGWEAADVVISGIPFSTLPKNIASEIMQNIYDSIKPGGLFVAYQLRDRVGKLATPHFGKAKIMWEYKNFPPMRIFVWQK
ncbi:MAG TPA: methyltransferase domain-containing protein [Oceanospirillales bacterium]|nr:methyltransferase domain-containing protein [Oceanospirillales bacterium]